MNENNEPFTWKVQTLSADRGQVLGMIENTNINEKRLMIEIGILQRIFWMYIVKYFVYKMIHRFDLII